MSLRKKVLETVNKKPLFTISDIPHPHRGETLGILFDLEDEGIIHRFGYLLEGQIWLMDDTNEWGEENIKPEGTKTAWCLTGHETDLWQFPWHGWG